VYSELFPCTTKLADLEFRPVGLILSGGPYSVYDEAVGQLLVRSFSFQFCPTSFHDA
jgi:GMP synthase-like glutamine amidotransferase